MHTFEDRHQSVSHGVGARIVVGAAVLILPLLAYTVAAIHTSVNIPYQDDFDSIGEFLEHYVSLHGFFHRIWWILTAQHVQYKLMLMNAIVAMQYHLIGHTNYRALQLIGDLAIPATCLLLWLILTRSLRPLTQRLWLFVAPCWIFFAMRYAETVNWTMSGLQNMAVIPLALATIFFLTSSRRHSFAWTLIFLAFSIATSGNGFVVAIVVSWLLLRDRRYPQLLSELAVVLVLATLYAYHYTVFQTYPPVSFPAALKALLLFPFAFLGNAANSPAQAIILGLVLIAGFFFLASKGWRRACPASFGGALFCLVTSIIVAGGRYRAGFHGAVAGHYRMYSLLFLALEYIGVVRLFVPASLTLRSRWGTGLALTGFAAVLFCSWADYYGYRDIHGRQRTTIAHLILWERHPDHLVLVPDEEPYEQTPEWLRLRVDFQQDLQRQIAEGLYIPPYSASDALPVRPHSPSTRGIEDETPPAKN